MRPVAAIATLLLSMSLAVMPSPLQPLSAAEPSKQAMTILAVGDSLTAGFRLKPSESFPAQLQMALEAKGYKVNVANAGVSGDTTAGGRNRLAWALEPKPDAVILELGANDALRGIKPAEARANLDAMLATLQQSRIPVLLAGMKAPGNWGADYARDFDSIYTDLAQKYGAALYPFFLEGVALDPAFVLDDGLHPSAAGIAEIVKRILPDVEALLQTASAAKAAAKN